MADRRLFEEAEDPALVVGGHHPVAARVVDPSKSDGCRGTSSPVRVNKGTDVKVGKHVAIADQKGVVDTGATVVAINVSTARKLGVSTQSKDFTFRVGTANGETTAAKVNLSRIEIGPISVSDVTAFVLDDQDLDETLIGMSFMSRLASYKVQGRELKLEN